MCNVDNVQITVIHVYYPAKKQLSFLYPTVWNINVCDVDISNDVLS